MSQTGLPTFDTTLHTTNLWLRELMEGLDLGDDRQKAYQALRVVLHALRDRLSVEAAAALGAQLPLLVRGAYYEGWHPADKPLKHHREQFLARVSDALHDHGTHRRPEDVVKAVFRILARHVSAGEVEHVKHALPEDLRGFWPSEH